MCRLLCVLILLAPAACAQSAPDQHPDSLAAHLAEVLSHDANGHSPTAEDISAFAALTPDAAAVTEALPSILKALDSTDATVRTLALTMLNGLETPPPDAPPPARPAAPDATQPTDQPQPAPPAPPGPAAYKSDVARALAPAIPHIAARLTDETAPNRLLAATALGGFFPDPPAGIYPPLLAYLKRDDAINSVGLLVVDDLLQLGPLSTSTVDALSRYLRRSDQTPSSRSDIVEAIASHPNQSQSLNKTLLAYLSSDDPSLRSRVILSLPQLDLAPDVFGDTKALVSGLATLDPASGQDNLQVITAAKSITACWTTVRMATGCPVY